MEELIFFGIIILFSILDSIARTRKKRQAQAPGETSRIPEEWQSEEEEYETYDDEPSYDDAYAVGGYEPKSLPEYVQPGSEIEPERAEAKSSEGMIPADIWEEIAGLAAGRVPEPKPVPRPDPPSLPVERGPARPVQRHRVHRSHAGYGTDPSSRAPSEQDGLDPLRVTLSRDAAAVRRQLGSHRKGALRQAVILQEVLGPPAALRPEAFRD